MGDGEQGRVAAAHPCGSILGEGGDGFTSLLPPARLCVSGAPRACS